MNDDLHFDYTTVGHVTVDVLDDGSQRPGGTAFYSALQAARLGLRACVVTAGAAPELEQLLAHYRDELELRITPAEHTTTLKTSGGDRDRRQRVLAWAGALTDVRLPNTDILHLAPVAREVSAGWGGRGRFVGLTAQGLVRHWDEAGGEVSLMAHEDEDWEAIAQRCDAIVLSETERASCAPLIAAAARNSPTGPLVAITAGPEPNTLLLPSGTTLSVTVPAVSSVDDIGAGDVFAAALFVALAEGREPQAAAAFANAAAAVRMQSEGPGAIGTRQAIEARLRAAGPAVA